MNLRALLRSLAWFLVAFNLAGAAVAESLSLEGYAEAVATVEEALERGDLAGVHAGARGLLDATVDFEAAALVPDRSLFAPLAKAPDLAAARAFLPRLGALRRALAARLEYADRALDTDLFQRLAADQASDTPQGEGFEIASEEGWLQALADLLRPIGDFLSKAWREFWEWLFELLRPEKADGGWLAGISLPSLVTVLVAVFAVALAVLALRAWRTRRRRAVGPSPAPVAPHPADDDPLSRDTGGWRRYARELAAAGRTREAIRAWYHAVLVALYGRGLVSYRKGRTNWEVVAALSPGLAFRPSFIEFTRLFDREWYGLRQSPPEALGEAEDLARGLLGDLGTQEGER
jgi:hypothetical protein